MITRLSLTNFKCFKSCDIKIAPLTVLAGINSVGKSTVIESMLLLRESQKRSENLEIPAFNLRLNNQYMHLGTDIDVLCDFSDNSEIRIKLYDTDTSDKERMFDGAWSTKVNEKSEPSSILQPIYMPQRKGDVEIFFKIRIICKK